MRQESNENAVAPSILLGSKMSEKKMPLTRFLTFFDTSQHERAMAMAYPLFSQGPHPKQEDMGKTLVQLFQPNL